MKLRDILIAKLTVALAAGIVLVEFVGHPSDGRAYRWAICRSTCSFLPR
ncbi:hypothetical protein SAMN04487993_10643 [Salipiger marinus]|uniref:Uncharacterized protein n=1 Tax=Salipiger marinus TaxID=555512 RepID=A0A1G8V3B4_9RHOB|nr:hypothetical protein SAMN04487993_10643 [Salipiger marinus]